MQFDIRAWPANFMPHASDKFGVKGVARRWGDLELTRGEGPYHSSAKPALAFTGSGVPAGRRVVRRGIIRSVEDGGCRRPPPVEAGDRHAEAWAVGPYALFSQDHLARAPPLPAGGAGGRLQRRAHHRAGRPPARRAVGALAAHRPQRRRGLGGVPRGAEHRAGLPDPRVVALAAGQHARGRGHRALPLWVQLLAQAAGGLGGLLRHRIAAGAGRPGRRQRLDTPDAHAADRAGGRRGGRDRAGAAGRGGSRRRRRGGRPARPGRRAGPRPQEPGAALRLLLAPDGLPAPAALPRLPRAHDVPAGPLPHARTTPRPSPVD